MTGLSSTEVQARIKRGEVNNFEPRSGRTYFEILRHNIFNVFNVMLFTMLLIVLLSGDFWTVLFAGFSVLTNSLIGTVQEINAKRKLNRLANLAPKHVVVLRDGQPQTILNKQVVIDDVILIRPGDRLVVDGEVIESDSLEIDESHLTGESDAVYKEVGDDVSSGSFCIAGTGMMRATRVGAKSTVNRLTTIAKAYKNTLTPTQKKIASIVKLALVFLTVFGPMVFISGWVRAESFLGIIRNTVVFTTSLVPQGLILTTILALTIGALKISRHQTLIQRVNAVESMANVTVLCFDKTGTMTRNHLAVREVIPLDTSYQLDEIEKWLQVYVHNLGHQNTTAAALARHLFNDQQPDDLPIKIREIPFTSARKWGAIVLADGAFALGAPERLLDEHHWGMSIVDDRASQGLRVLTFAKIAEPPPHAQHIARDTIKPMALIVIEDQVRDDIRETLDSFRAQGVRPKVISGDNLATVRAVAHYAGMQTQIAYEGWQLDDMTDAQLRDAVQEADVFARVEPDTKRRIVSALRAQGEYVAMVGDGVNDVPALKEADLAIVMNDGAQISKDVADIVLLNNAMSTLPLAFHEGTEITQTLYGTTKIFLTKNVYNTLLFIFVLFMSLPFPITPIQISWASFGTANIPGGLMALGWLRPARINIFRRDVLDYIITGGFVGAVGMALMYVVTYRYTNYDVDVSRSATTIFFILYSLSIYLFVCGIDVAQPRTYGRYPFATILTIVLTGGAVIAASLFPDVFEFVYPPFEIIVLILAIWLLCVLIVSVGMRNRAMLHQFYTLAEVTERDIRLYQLEEKGQIKKAT
ncbi:MAG: ATPase P [Phototrophicales bacterium]|nr:MAG: ATPase P [Phototrophicales bacterium]